MKKKRGAAYVYHQQKKAVKQGQLPRFRRLRLVRRTRFNSRVACLDSFLLNVPLLRRISTSQAFADCMKVTQKGASRVQPSYLAVRYTLSPGSPGPPLDWACSGFDASGWWSRFLFLPCCLAPMSQDLVGCSGRRRFHGCRAKAF